MRLTPLTLPIAAALAAAGCWTLDNPRDCQPRCPQGVECVDRRCVYRDAGPDAVAACPVGRTGAYCKLCEVGYTGAGCTGCSREYAKVAVGGVERCEFSPPASCLADHGWLMEGYLPPLSHTGGGEFKIDGTPTEPVVVDQLTGIAWRRCAVGQTWDKAQGSCSGSPKGGARNEKDKLPAGTCGGSYGGHSDWRVPEQDELESLVSYDRRDPVIDASVYFIGLPLGLPGDPDDYFWTATVGKTSWMGKHEAKVSFKDGTVSHMEQYSANYPFYEYAQVLCARRQRKALTRRWQVEAQDGSTVRDLWTDLIWKRCAHGQVWDGKERTCAKTPTKVALSAATNACKAPWRLPSVRELAAMRKLCGETPRIDTAAFPNVSVDTLYWSATSYAGNAGKAWIVNMNTSAVASDATSKPYYARCVRGTARTRP